jgi:hypothetical protein
MPTPAELALERLHITMPHGCVSEAWRGEPMLALALRLIALLPILAVFGNDQESEFRF